MTVSWTSTFDNPLSGTWSVTIYRKALISGDTGLLTLDAEPLTISYSADDVFSEIYAGVATLRIIDDGTAATNEFIAAMAEAKDGQFLFKLHKGTLIHFYGIVMPDGFVRSANNTPGRVLEIKAASPLIYMKGQKLQKIDGTVFKGRNTIKDYLLAICTNAHGMSDLSSTAVINWSHRLTIARNPMYDPSLPYPDATTYPAFWEQVKIPAEAFNDQDGRPINAQDALIMICKALKMRCTIQYNQYWFESLEGIPFQPTTQIQRKGLLSVFLGNKETVQKERVYKEVKVTFPYKETKGGLIGGNIISYGTNGIPDGVDYILPSHASTTDFNDRKRGNGRIENPLGFMLRHLTKSVTEPVYGTVHEIDKVDMLGFRTTDYALTTGNSITVTVDAYLDYDDQGYKPYGKIKDDEDNTATTRMIFDAFIYNDTDPSNSRRLMRSNDGSPIWQTVNLSTSNFASGHYDFSLNARNTHWMCSSVEVDTATRGKGVNAVAYQSQYGYPLTFKAIPHLRQSVSQTLPDAPISGTLYIGISGIINPGKVYWQQLRNITEWGDTVITGVGLSMGSSRKKKLEQTYQAAYLTRNISASIDTKTEAIELSTISDPSIGGGLWTDIKRKIAEVNYFGATLPMYKEAGYIDHVENTVGTEKMSLPAYNAWILQRYNENRFTIRFSAMMGYVGARDKYKFPDHQTNALPSGFSDMVFLPVRMDWDVKSGNTDGECTSMKHASRNISTTELNDTNDLIEEYI